MPNINSSTSTSQAEPMPYVNFIKEFAKYNLLAEINTDLKISQKNNKIILNGIANVDNLSFKIDKKQLPESFIHSKFDKKQSILNSKIYLSGNENFVLDVDLVSAFENYLPDVINFSISQIMVRRKKFNLYFLNKKYQTNGSKTEKFLNDNNFKNVKNQIVMVKDYYKRVSENEKYTKPAIAFSEINQNPAFKKMI